MMFARCPSCQTIFEVDDEVLSARVGMVRCGICAVTFNASWNLLDRLPGVDLPAELAPPPAAEPDGQDSATGHGDEVSSHSQAEPGISDEAAPSSTIEPAYEVESVAVDTATGSESIAAQAEADMAAVEVDDSGRLVEVIEIESESIVEEVARLDDALLRKKVADQRTQQDQAGLPEDEQHGDIEKVIPDHEIVLETPAEAWQGLRPDTQVRPSARQHARISASVDQMRAMLNPVAEREPDTGDEDGVQPATEAEPTKKRVFQRTQMPPELDPLGDGGIDSASGNTEASTAPDVNSGSQTGTAAVESASSAVAWRVIAWFLGFVLILLTTLWQVKKFYLHDLAQFPAMRPVLSEFCRFAACEVPPRRDSRRIDLVGTNVETHPAVPGALRVVVSLINRAEFSQLPPLLQVTLSNRTGQVVGQRTYAPGDYVTSTLDATLEPNVVSNVTIDLAAPSDSAVGYEIQLIPD